LAAVAPLVEQQAVRAIIRFFPLLHQPVVVVEAHTLQMPQQEGRVEALRASALD
jgi:hypothetical protein